MNEWIDPKTFGLRASTEVRQLSNDLFVLVIRRKSRIIMKDGAAILAKVSQIKTALPQVEIRVQTTAPVCSKTRSWLREHQVEIDTI